MIVEPLLRTLDVGIAVIALAFEDDKRSESVLMPLQGEHAGDLLRGGRAGVARDEVEHEVVPAHRRPRAHQFFTRARDHEHAFRLNRHGRIGARERTGVAEVHRRVLAVEEACFRQ